MDSLKEQIDRFDACCDEVTKAKFIMATTKMRELLKCIVSSPNLYALFDAMTKDFDYSSVRKKCLVTVTDGVYNRSYLVLPQDPDECLPFIFCLLVEFDREDVNFNDFLRKYFNEDGSYVSSYQKFCSVVIDTFKALVDKIYDESQKELHSHDAPAGSQREKIEQLQKIIDAEREYLSASELDDEDKKSGLSMLDEMKKAVKRDDATLVNALVCGYNYFSVYFKLSSDNVSEIVKKLYEIERKS